MSRSASASTSSAFLPPSSSEQPTSRSPARLATVRAIRSAVADGPAGARDPELDALALSTTTLLGVDALVLGSDRPYGEPLEALLGDAASHAVRAVNPRRLLGAGSSAALGGGRAWPAAS